MIVTIPTAAIRPQPEMTLPPGSRDCVRDLARTGERRIDPGKCLATAGIAA